MLPGIMSQANRYMIDNAEVGNMIDIGACVGEITETMAERLKNTEFNVYAIEPDHEAYELLQKNTVSLSNIKTFQMAITEKNGHIRLFTSRMYGHTTNEYNAQTCKWGHNPNNFRENVVTRTLDTFVEENGITQITAIKIDCEAGEEFVLRGSRKTLTENKVMIALETHDNINCEAIYNMLREYGYQVFNSRLELVDRVVIDGNYICKNY